MSDDAVRTSTHNVLEQKVEKKMYTPLYTPVFLYKSGLWGTKGYSLHDGIDAHIP